MTGSGDPPVLLQVNSKGLPSVATALFPGDTDGCLGGAKTVRAMLCSCKLSPEPPAFTRHSNRPLSRSYEAFLIKRS